MKSAYQKISEKELNKRANDAWKLLESCTVCPRKCKVNRLKGEKGWCQAGVKPKIASYHAHFGEEAPLVGTHGSGTIFFSSCNLACKYCQNYDISHYRSGEEVDFEELANIMLSLEHHSCHNINFVSPTIWVPQMLKALIIARKKGLKVPLVYNSGGYDSVKTLKLLDGIIDIYMSDIKYSDSKTAKKYSDADNYWETAQSAVKEMHQQVGGLKINDKGIARRGLLIRHLVLPNDLAGTEKVMEFLAGISKNTYINIMDQYYPVHKAGSDNKLNRRITSEEYTYAINNAKKQGLHRLNK